MLCKECSLQLLLMVTMGIAPMDIGLIVLLAKAFASKEWLTVWWTASHTCIYLLLIYKNRKWSEARSAALRIAKRWQKEFWILPRLWLKVNSVLIEHVSHLIPVRMPKDCFKYRSQQRSSRRCWTMSSDWRKQLDSFLPKLSNILRSNILRSSCTGLSAFPHSLHTEAIPSSHSPFLSSLKRGFI